ncbi:MAG: aminotransferase class I/II-fold pyridoxal phosphate-dependent enzyme [Ruminococcaceae bacterium]|nr:aminotransferase class I/II-fold pyridoxal phosphate-dependent enzyme [Oscillospiraceae bacterium]
MMIDYNKVLSKTVVNTPKSGIRKFFDLMNTMEDVVGLTVGEPDFQTPWHIREAGITSLEKGKTYYTANAGLTELRHEINNYMTRRFGISYIPEKEVIVTVGGSEAIDIAFRSVIEPGDEVIVPTPSFVCYAPLARMSGANPVILETKLEDNFKINPEALKAAITSKTKLLVLPYPNNPTGAIMTKSELEEIAEILRDTNILVLSDEIYAELTYTGDHCSIASLEGMRERTIIASGFSKAYAMTGWRLGYICAPAPLAEQMLKIHQYGIMSSPTTSQFAAIEALRNGDDDIAMMRDEYNRRRRYIYNGLKSIGIDSFEPEGAFYIFPKIGEFGISGEEFCSKLLYDYKCAIVPGNAFGESGDGFARISYAYSIKHITQALERIEAFVQSLKK